MSQLDYYDLPSLIAVDHESNPRDPSQTRPIDVVPGVMVRHRDWPQLLGIALSRCWLTDDRPMQVLVLWQQAPGLFNIPVPRHVNYHAIAQQLVQVQPMTLPAGSIFCLDYAYGSGSVKPEPGGG
jgi:hypothetical protein